MMDNAINNACPAGRPRRRAPSRIATAVPAALALCALVAAPARAQQGAWEFSGWYGGGQYPVIAADRNNPGVYYLGSDVSGLWRSDDYGDNWRFINNGVVSLHVAALAVAPSNSRIVYAGTKSGLMRSLDGGGSWQGMRSTLSRITFQRPVSAGAISVDPRNPYHIIVGSMKGQVWEDPYGGETWALLGPAEGPFGRGKDAPVTAVVYDAARDTVLAAARPGIARFNRATNSWTRVSDQPALDMGITPNGRLFAGAGNRVIYSDDGGESWSQLNPIPKGEVRQVDWFERSGGPPVILAGWGDGWSGGAFLSRDGGETWRNIETGLNYAVDMNPTRAWMKGFERANSVLIDPRNPNRLFYTDSWGVWRSDDAGAEWREIIRGSPAASGSGLAIDGSGRLYASLMDQGLVSSSDGGQTFAAVCPSDACGNLGRHVWQTLVSRNGRRIVATSSPWHWAGNEVLVSEDGGRTFKTSRNGLPGRFPTQNTLWGKGYARSLAFDPRKEKTIYLGIDGTDGGGLYISEDGGFNWRRSEGQPGSLRIYNGLAVDPSDSGALYWAACDVSGGVFRSTDRGRSWKRVLGRPACVFDLAVAPNGDAYAAATDNGPVLLASRDGGETWAQIKRFPGSSGTAEAVAFNPADADQIFVGVVEWGDRPGGAIYVSPDGGETWRLLDRGLPENSGPAAMVVDPERGYLYALLYAGSVYRFPLSAITEN